VALPPLTGSTYGQLLASSCSVHDEPPRYARSLLCQPEVLLFWNHTSDGRHICHASGNSRGVAHSGQHARNSTGHRRYSHRNSSVCMQTACVSHVVWSVVDVDHSLPRSAWDNHQKPEQQISGWSKHDRHAGQLVLHVAVRIYLTGYSFTTHKTGDTTCTSYSSITNHSDGPQRLLRNCTVVNSIIRHYSTAKRYASLMKTYSGGTGNRSNIWISRWSKKNLRYVTLAKWSVHGRAEHAPQRAVT
jgi:hypothetical protein